MPVMSHNAKASFMLQLPIGWDLRRGNASKGWTTTKIATSTMPWAFQLAGMTFIFWRIVVAANRGPLDC